MSRKIFVIVSAFLILIGARPVVAAASISDTLSNSNISTTSGHNVEVELGNFATTTNGSVKILFDNSFDLSGLVPVDVSIVGGDVAWQPAVIDAPAKSIVIPFAGNLDQTDGTISLQVGSVNYITNPPTVGAYSVEFFVYQNNNGTGDINYQTGSHVHINNLVNVQAQISETLSFIVTGVASGENVNGATTNIASTNNTIDYGTLNGASNLVAAQDLSVNTNATDGFTVTVNHTQTLTSGPDTINDFIGTNASPVTWISPPSSGIEGYFGYTTDDPTLGTGTPDRFIANKWAGLSASPLEIFYHDDPAGGSTTGIGITRIGFQIEITNWQESGTYTTTINYICTATY